MRRKIRQLIWTGMATTAGQRRRGIASGDGKGRAMRRDSATSYAGRASAGTKRDKMMEIERVEEAKNTAAMRCGGSGDGDADGQWSLVDGGWWMN